MLLVGTDNVSSVHQRSTRALSKILSKAFFAASTVIYKNKWKGVRYSLIPFVVNISTHEILKYFHFSQSYSQLQWEFNVFIIFTRTVIQFSITKSVAKLHIHITSASSTQSKNIALVCNYDSQSYTFILRYKSQFVYHSRFPENSTLIFSSFDDPFKGAYHFEHRRYQRIISFSRNANSFFL